MNPSIIGIKIYVGKLGHETYLTTVNGNSFPQLPQKADLIAVGKPEDTIVYKVKQALFDYSGHEYNLFVEEYDWE